MGRRTGWVSNWLAVRVRGVRSGLIALAVAGGMLFAFAAPAAAKHSDSSARLPIVFVHGGAGSGAQYASVAKRFASNGYPPDRIKTFEYDSSSAAAIAAAPAGLDNLIDQLRAHYHVDRVNLVGHSLGTFVSGNYLSVPARAAKIAHYVGVDGASNPSCGIGDPNLACMGIFRGTTGDVGGSNVYFNNTQSHVEAATSPQSFAAQYKFFTGEDPKTTLILPEPPGQVRIAGRAVNFPQNAGIDGATLRIWEVKRATGARKPAAGGHLADRAQRRLGTGEGQRQEVLRVRAAAPRYHGGGEPLLPAVHSRRLLGATAQLAAKLGDLQNTILGPNHAAAVLIRYREWWTTNPSGQEDILRISTKSRTRGNQPPVNVLQNVISSGLVVGAPVGVHVHDNPADGVSSLNVIPFFATQPFQTGVDVYMPATTRPDGTITFYNAQRGDTSRPQVLNTPNWASDAHRISVNLNDYVQDINSWDQCKRKKPSLCRRGNSQRPAPESRHGKGGTR